MKRIVWINDIHFDFLHENQITEFMKEIILLEPEALLIGGDIGLSTNVGKYLSLISTKFALPIYFVLGNHDYYYGSMPSVHRTIKELIRHSKHLNWLPESGIIPLTDSTGLIGDGGWGDGRAGNFINSNVLLSDYRLIEDLTNLSKDELLKKLNYLGDKSAKYIKQILPKAAASFSQLYYLTHVPPFHEACIYDGKLSDKDWSPHFTCVASGKMISKIMVSFPETQLTVLCGHTHGEGFCRISHNIRVFTGSAEYGNPRISKVFEIN